MFGQLLVEVTGVYFCLKIFIFHLPEV
jgi:hypothetical protein